MSMMEDITQSCCEDGVTLPVVEIPLTATNAKQSELNIEQSETTNSKKSDVLTNVAKDTLGQFSDLMKKKGATHEIEKNLKDEADVEGYTKIVNGKEVHVKGHKRNLNNKS